MIDVFILMSELLNERLSEGAHMTEDNVRYTFYLAAIQHGDISHTEINLEYPHPVIANAEIDTFVKGDSKPSGIAIEFKYDRSNPGGTNQNRTQRAGAFLADIFRLNLIPETTASDRYFVYLTDKEMASYFQNPQNRFTRLYNLVADSDYALDLDFVNSLAKSASNQVKGIVKTCKITGYYKKELIRGHQLRVYSIINLIDSEHQV